jgi:hypothetical protein
MIPAGSNLIQIWTGSKLPFVQLDERLPAYERQAPSRDVFLSSLG